MDPTRIAGCWTHCYHVTFDINVASIRECRVLLSAAALFAAANEEHLATQRRISDVMVRVGKHAIAIRNQRPLNPSSIDLAPGVTLDEYVACLNLRTFFWPGTIAGPVADGVWMLEEGSGPNGVMIRIPTRSLFRANAATSPYLSTCNTGSAHIEKKRTRGPDVFELIEQFTGDPLAITEISFANEVRLPRDTRYASTLAGPWRSFFRAGAETDRSQGDGQ